MANNTENNSANNTENNSANSTENNSANSTENNSANSTENNSANNTENNSANNTENNSANNTENNSANNTENNTANNDKNTVTDAGNSVTDAENNSVSDDDKKTVNNEDKKTVNDEDKKTVNDEDKKTANDEEKKTTNDEEKKIVNDEEKKIVNDEGKKAENDEEKKTVNDDVKSIENSPKKETEKDNIFYKFDNIKRIVGKKERARRLYLDYNKNFSTKERKVIDEFRQKYEENKDITVMETMSNQDQKVISNFIRWSDSLPKMGLLGIPYKCYQIKKLVKSLFSIEVDIKKEEEPTKEYKDSDNSYNIKRYIKERWEDQRNYFDRKASISQKKYRCIHRWLIVLSALSALVISLHINGILGLYSTKDEKEKQQLCERYNTCYDSLKEQYTDLDSTDKAMLDSLPVPPINWEKADTQILKNNIQKANSILLKYPETVHCNCICKCICWNRVCNLFYSVGNWLCSIWNWIVEVWWEFWWWIQSCDIEKGICAICSFVIVILTGFDRLMKHYEEWHRNRENCEKLNRELYNYHYNVGEYNSKDNDNKKESIFVDRVETIINDYMKDMLSEKNKFTKQQMDEMIEEVIKRNKTDDTGGLS